MIDYFYCLSELVQQGYAKRGILRDMNGVVDCLNVLCDIANEENQ